MVWRVKTPMKTDLHPTYNEETPVKCACGNEFTTGSTQDSLSVEICAACHPFFTGKQKYIDTAQRLKKFEERQAKADKLAAEFEETKARRAAKKQDESVEEPKAEVKAPKKVSKPAKAEVKAEAKPEPKAEVKTEEKAEKKSEDKPAEQ